ncbi:MAG: protein-methionine-sulfoxide reductase catalytic subunit MsrP [Gammaproteobacteria bacterium]|nr:MAG: protein-methionine-sulfoxide reductase catalytic subunit MsrP [Gammaproteobacteria bacterium]
MLIKSPKSYQLKDHDVTDETVYQGRRTLLKSLGFIGASGLLAHSTNAQAGLFDLFKKDPVKPFKVTHLHYKKASETPQILTPEAKVTSHNNFYEFGAQKSQPAQLAQQFKVDPWQLTISGHCNNPYQLDYDDLFTSFDLEERIYRLRCVETWSMVIPWLGFPLAKLLQKAQPNSRANYVVFETLYDPQQMPGQKNRRLGGGISYPYVEGLRIDEAMNPLTLMSVGLYGKTLPPQNGAPIRLVVPWKYGFKSIKSIVAIKFVEHQPANTWNILIPREYGFYANVNPQVDHPRWSQASERRLTTGGLLARNRIKTLMFNGYSEEVAGLYKGMNLHKYY